MLKTLDLTFAYDAKNQFAYPNFQTASDTPLLILGASGCGKTTLLFLLGGLLRPTKGKVLIDETDITTLNNRQLDHFRGQNIGIIYQKSHFVQSLNAWDNLRLPAYLSKTNFDEKYLEETLKRLKIFDKIHQKTQRLSQGEQQRLAIARSIVNRPKLILADEPTASLDDENCFEVIDVLKEHATLAKAELVIVTHDQRLKDVFSSAVVL